MIGLNRKFLFLTLILSAIPALGFAQGNSVKGFSILKVALGHLDGLDLSAWTAAKDSNITRDDFVSWFVDSTKSAAVYVQVDLSKENPADCNQYTDVTIGYNINGLQSSLDAKLGQEAEVNLDLASNTSSRLVMIPGNANQQFNPHNTGCNFDYKIFDSKHRLFWGDSNRQGPWDMPLFEGK